MYCHYLMTNSLRFQSISSEFPLSLFLVIISYETIVCRVNAHNSMDDDSSSICMIGETPIIRIETAYCMQQKRQWKMIINDKKLCCVCAHCARYMYHISVDSELFHRYHLALNIRATFVSVLSCTPAPQNCSGDTLITD